MVNMQHCGVTLDTFNANTGETQLPHWIKQHIIKSLHHVLKQTYTYHDESLGKLNFKPLCLLDEEHPGAEHTFAFPIYPAKTIIKIITQSHYTYTNLL
jgi:hypothetical protein